MAKQQPFDDPIVRRYRNQIIQVTAQHGGLHPRLFGSRAHGHASETSDLDILVEMASGRDLLDLVAMKQDLEDILGCPVDVVSQASLAPQLKDRILREALKL